MTVVPKVLVGVVAALLGLLGVRWMFAPVSIAAEMGIQLDGPVALSTVRGDLGGMFIAGALLCIAGLRSGDGRWLQAVAVLIGLVAVGRSVGLVLDGVNGTAVGAIGAEIAIVAVLLFGASRLEATRT